MRHHVQIIQPQCSGEACDAPSPFGDAADLDRVSLDHIRGAGVRRFLLATIVACGVTTAALLVLTAVLWGAQ